MTNKQDALRKKKQKRQKKRREGKVTEAEMSRRKKQADEEYIMEEETKETEEAEFTSSEEYEIGANEALAEGEPEAAQVLATLALTATIRESVFILAEIMDPDGGEDDGE